MSSAVTLLRIAIITIMLGIGALTAWYEITTPVQLRMYDR
jgi:hypothetical protein